MQTKYQQGDVIMRRINDDYDIAEENKSMKKLGGNNKSAVLALGEVTGHSHQIKPVDGVLVHTFNQHNSYLNRTSPEASFMEIAGEGAVLTHEEHNPVELPPGKYKINIVRQFNHITKMGERVWD
tara:strand:+ start:493 stop:867 length:375 start_codon:yes stop_codon:yes gene_type:complete